MSVRRVVLLGAFLFACRQPEPASAPPSAAASMSRGDELILAAVRVGLPPAGVTGADLPDPHSQGAGLMMSYCAQCHALPTPVAHSATDWPGVVRRMWIRMDYLPDSFGIHRPTGAERYVILSYLTTNALRVSGAVLPSAAGRQSFELVCSRCHALPDPLMHSPNDWEAVVARMEQNMERMHVSLATTDQITDIVTFLKTASAGRARGAPPVHQ